MAWRVPERRRGWEKMLHQRGWVYGDIVILDRTVLSGHRFDVHDLESLVFEFVNGAGEDIVSFAFKFRSGASCALFQRKGCGVQAVRMGLAGRIFRLQLHFGSKRGGSLGLVVEPARRRDQHEDNDEDYCQIIRPTAAFVGPEDGADDASP